MSQQVNATFSLAQRLNKSCLRPTLDKTQLTNLFGYDYPSTMFSPYPVYIEPHYLLKMQDIITAIESVITLPAYQQRVLQWAPDSAQKESILSGVCMGYDFHLSADGPKLIEINTNAGGLLLNIKLLQAQKPCCDAVSPVADPRKLLDELLFTFLAEWRRQRGELSLRTIAIVDEHPHEQFLYPEFLLFAELFKSAGYEVVIVDPRELVMRNGTLWHEQTCIDMVYNRLTDFDLSAPCSSELRSAYLQDAIVLTPNPRLHALYADKRNLTLLSNADELIKLDVDKQTQDTLLNAIPKTVVVNAEDQDQFWSQRNQWFFKPSSGYGGKAVYRGDKITRKVFASIMQGGYLAQSLAAPGERHTGETGVMKLDWRNYTYQGKVQLLAARLYQGQTTNFRTAGGGFATAYQTRENALPPCLDA